MTLTRPTVLRRKVRNFMRWQLDRGPLELHPTSLLETPIRPGVDRSTFVHVANFSPWNAGDTLLPTALRDSVTHEIGAANWQIRHAHRATTDRAVRRINRTSGLIIGGGGLFLRDTNENALSGWQWTCSVDALRAITVPIAVLAVGYNRFRGQSDFLPVFREHLGILAEKAVILGIRNSGSVEKLRAYLPEDLHHKLVLHPCPTTIMGQIYPEANRPAPSDPGKWAVALNCAFDRREARYGDREAEILGHIAASMLDLSKNFSIRYHVHVDTDEEMLPYLDRLGVKYETVRLNNASPQEVLAAYSGPVISLGMRGHAKMIPLGCGRPIISLSTHDKLKYFLDDIGAPEWNIDMGEDNVRERIVAQVDEIGNQLPDRISNIKRIQERLWSLSQRNIARVRDEIYNASLNA
jgi:polysaccharide pyruvyl transferase WcaK-like protein